MDQEKRQPVGLAVANFWLPRITVVVLGISLAFFAKAIFGPYSKDQNQRQFEHLVDQPQDSRQPAYPAQLGEGPQFQLDQSNNTETDANDSSSINSENETDASSLVPPLVIPDLIGTDQSLAKSTYTDVVRAFDNFTHDKHAHFHAHGNTICASGCAASRHPTAQLDEASFHDLIFQYATEPMDETSVALETLLYFGPQTKSMLEKFGFGQLDRRRADFLWQQLKITHALISIRVVDDQGIVRSWLEPTRVPFDRRHEFHMQANQVQPNETSGTVKRVGLYHLWTRL